LLYFVPGVYASTVTKKVVGVFIAFSCAATLDGKFLVCIIPMVSQFLRIVGTCISFVTTNNYTAASG
jgi:hypothetical protein